MLCAFALSSTVGDALVDGRRQLWNPECTFIDTPQPPEPRSSAAPSPSIASRATRRTPHQSRSAAANAATIPPLTYLVDPSSSRHLLLRPDRNTAPLSVVKFPPASAPHNAAFNRSSRCPYNLHRYPVTPTTYFLNAFAITITPQLLEPALTISIDSRQPCSRRPLELAERCFWPLRSMPNAAASSRSLPM